MSDQNLLRLSGVAALLGGLLRVSSPFFGMLLPDEALHLLWAGTDLLLLLGTFGLWASTRRATGVWGVVALVVMLIGLLLVRTSAERIFGPQSYGVGAGIWGLGQAILGAALLITRSGFRVSSILWLVSLVLGLAGERIDLWLDGFGWAGIVFAAGWICAGLTLARRKEPVP